ncbi:MAG: Gfo/Idh/MocA family oxidoreductase [Micropruina sp.]|nr:Gfo/Idh/MocA family oxidoreductase [Micropruina sp.]
MTDTIRWGILGAGKISAVFVENLLAEGLTVSAVAARSGASAQQFADRFGIPAAHEGYTALVEDPNVDVIYIGTTQNFHRDHALLAIAAGKPVLVEKAFTVNAAEAKEIASAASAGGVFVTEAMWTRFLPSLEVAQRWISEGAIGEVVGLHSDHSQSLDTSPEGRHHNPALGGGALLDLGIYNVFFAHALLGAPKEIVVRGKVTATGVDAEVSMLLVHADGAVSTGRTTMIGPGSNRAVVMGSTGYLEFDPYFFGWTGVSRFDNARPANLVERYEPH